MRMRVLLVCVLLLALCLAGGQPASARSAGDTAFLSEYAESPDQVVSQVQANRLIALRYARVFMKDPSAVLSYFRTELSLVTLDQPMQVVLFHLDENRRVVSETHSLKAGTKVFANSSGYPVLEYGTGNPLTSSLPAKGQPRPAANQVVQNPEPQAPPKPTAASVQPVTGTDPGQKVVEQIIADNGNAPVVPNSAPLAPATPANPVTAPVPGGGNLAGGSGGGGNAGISSASKWLPALGAIAAAAALAGGGGSGSSGITGGGDDGGGSNPPLVPEPASILVLGAGLMTLGGLIRRRK